ncbi:MAG TPA: neutral/alkaline non-lysosomal ceramidase N-terminal domain-containing protein [Candidatus Brocadiia bacterium]|nr:neutral/alkaline non-lysosomal ceramidase N-terminal domain-containing protein [Candidatus Brocadiia bacterium]
MSGEIRFGSSQVDVTPQVGVELSGYLARQQPSVGLHDRIHARSLVIESSGRKAVLTVCDVLGFPDKLADEIRQAIAEKAGTDVDLVMLWGTHTHSGPAVASLNNCGTPDPKYIEVLRAGVIKSAGEAARELRPCSLYWAQTTCDVSRNRRIAWGSSRAAPPVPKELSLISCNDLETGKVLATLMHYTCHCVVMGGENRLISADLAGAAAGELSRVLSGSPTVLYANGACGDINPNAHPAGFDTLAQVGATMAQSAMSALSKPENIALDGIEGRFAQVELPARIMTEADLSGMARECREQERKARTENESFKARMFDAHAMWAEGLLEKSRAGAYPASIQLRIHRLQLGPVNLLGLSAEPLSYFSHVLRDAAPPWSLLVGYCDGLYGYLPSPEAMPEGGYEVSDACKYYGTPPLEAGAPRVAEKAIRGMLA